MTWNISSNHQRLVEVLLPSDLFVLCTDWGHNIASQCREAFFHLVMTSLHPCFIMSFSEIPVSNAQYLMTLVEVEGLWILQDLLRIATMVCEVRCYQWPPIHYLLPLRYRRAPTSVRRWSFRVGQVLLIRKWRPLIGYGCRESSISSMRWSLFFEMERPASQPSSSTGNGIYRYAQGTLTCPMLPSFLFMLKDSDLSPRGLDCASPVGASRARGLVLSVKTGWDPWLCSSSTV